MISLPSPAKINIYLHVFPCNTKDRYHSIKSITYKINYYDYIDIECKNCAPNRNSKNTKYALHKVSGPYANGISLCDNTITQSMRYLDKHHGLQYNNLCISLRKNIPHGSGLGSSSSNAGIFLFYIHKKYSVPWNIISSCAKSIGSDVSLFLYQKEKCHLIYGYGQNVKHCPRIQRSFEGMYIVIIGSCILSTKKVYSSFRSSRKHIHHFMNTFRNDLLASAIKFTSSIQENLSELLQNRECFYCNMTGSGSSCFGIFLSYYYAKKCYDKFHKKNKNVFIARL